MLGIEPEIISNFVEQGDVRLVFMPVLNHGDPSVFSTASAICLGMQDPALFWDMHNALFVDQQSIWGADRQYYADMAVSLGGDEAAFAECYDSGTGVSSALALDAIRVERGIWSQPVFDINGSLYYGAPSYDIFAQVFNFELSSQSSN